MAESRRGDRKFAGLPPGIVQVRLRGSSAPGLAGRLTSMPGVSVVTGPDEYPGDRVYLTVMIDGEEGDGDSRG